MKSLLDNIELIYNRKQYIKTLLEPTQPPPLEIKDNIYNLPNKFYLLSYGSNDIAQLANRLITSENTVRVNSLDHKQENWERWFFGNSRTWGGSVATIRNIAGKNVSGILVEFRKDTHNNFWIGNTRVNFKNLANSEAFPKKYYLHYIDIKNDIPIYAFIHNPVWMTDKTTKTVSNSYLKAICRMLRDRRKLMSGDNQTELNKKYYIDIRYIDPTVSNIQFSGTQKSFSHNQINN